MASSLQLVIPPEVRALIPPAVAVLSEVSVERLRNEFIKVLEAPKPSVSLRLLDRFGVLEFLIPETEAMKKVSQSEPHIYDVWEHSLHTVQALEGILKLLDVNYVHDNEDGGDLFSGLLSSLLGRYRKEITEHLATDLVVERPYRPLIFLAALLHDFTKPAHRSVEEDGRIRFVGHEVSGGKQIVERGEALKLSRVEIQRLSRILYDHMRPWHLSREDGELSKRAIHRFWRTNGPAGVDICLVSLADLRGIYGHTLTKEIMTCHIKVVRMLLEAYFEQPEVISPPSLLDGYDLMKEFDLSPGPQIGELLDLLRETQAEGEVQTRDQALAFIIAHLGR
jgi:tRNA nucleotidyltransferase/poly(A) polymerase